VSKHIEDSHCSAHYKGTVPQIQSLEQGLYLRDCPRIRTLLLFNWNHLQTTLPSLKLSFIIPLRGGEVVSREAHKLFVAQDGNILRKNSLNCRELQ